MWPGPRGSGGEPGKALRGEKDKGRPHSSSPTCVDRPAPVLGSPTSLTAHCNMISMVASSSFVGFLSALWVTALTEATRLYNPLLSIIFQGNVVTKSTRGLHVSTAVRHSGLACTLRALPASVLPSVSWDLIN